MNRFYETHKSRNLYGTEVEIWATRDTPRRDLCIMTLEVRKSALDTATTYNTPPRTHRISLLKYQVLKPTFLS